MELKSVIARQPGLEVEEQLLVYQQTLKDKVKQLSAMDQVTKHVAFKIYVNIFLKK